MLVEVEAPGVPSYSTAARVVTAMTEANGFLGLSSDPTPFSMWLKRQGSIRPQSGRAGAGWFAALHAN